MPHTNQQRTFRTSRLNEFFNIRFDIEYLFFDQIFVVWIFCDAHRLRTVAYMQMSVYYFFAETGGVGCGTILWMGFVVFK
jgi:hypothetical protein